MDARPFLPPYDQRQYEMVPISLDVLDVIFDAMPGIQATKLMGTNFGKAADEPEFYWHKAKVHVQAQGQVRKTPIRHTRG